MKVSQSVIDEFKKMGMAAALKKYKAGEGSEEFNEGIKRFYPSASKDGPAVSPVSVDESTTPKSPAVVTTKNKFTKTTEDTPGWKQGMTAAQSKANVANIKAAAKRKSRGKGLGDAKNAGEFISRLGRNLGSVLGTSPAQEKKNKIKAKVKAEVSKTKADVKKKTSEIKGKYAI